MIWKFKFFLTYIFNLSFIPFTLFSLFAQLPSTSSLCAISNEALASAHINITHTYINIALWLLSFPTFSYFPPIPVTLSSWTMVLHNQCLRIYCTCKLTISRQFKLIIHGIYKIILVVKMQHKRLFSCSSHFGSSINLAVFIHDEMPVSLSISKHLLRKILLLFLTTCRSHR